MQRRLSGAYRPEHFGSRLEKQCDKDRSTELNRDRRPRGDNGQKLPFWFRHRDEPDMLGACVTLWAAALAQLRVWRIS